MLEPTEEAELGGVAVADVIRDGIPVRVWCWPAALIVGRPRAGVDLHRRSCHACVNGITVPKSVRVIRRVPTGIFRVI